MPAGPDSVMRLLMMLALPMSGGNDLLDFVPTQEYWESKRITITVPALTAELTHKQPPDISELIRQLGDDRFAVREIATRKIQALGSQVVVQLEKALDSTDAEIVDRARLLIAQMDEGRNATAERRLMAIRALGELKSPEALPALRKLTSSKELFVAEYARQAIARIEGKEAKRTVVDRKQLEKDVWLLPAGCAVIGQLAPRSHIPLSLDQLRTITPRPGSSRRQNVSPREQLRRAVLKLSEQIGNVRVDVITMGISGDVGPRTGWVVFIARGQYDKDALKTLATESKIRVTTRDGVDVIEFDRRLQAIMPSNRQLIIIGGPQVAGFPFAELIAAVKAGRGKIAEDAPIAKLIKTVDRDGPVWMAAVMSPQFKKNAPLLAGLKTATLSTKHGEGAVTGKLVVTGDDEKGIEKSEAIFIAELRTMMNQMTKETSRMPAVKTMLDFLKTINHQGDGAIVTVTAELKDPRAALMMPLAIMSPYMLSRF